MIEIICKDDSENTVQDHEGGNVFLPKNIRQVGSPRGRHRIYLEDYVYTYLRSEAKNHEKCAAVFLGKSQVVKDIRYTFVSGVVECSAAVFQWENICLDESFWDYIYKEQKQFFSEMEIVGWVLGKAGQAMELTPAVEAAHRKYFAGRDKVLMLLDILEGEELFFVYEQGYLQKREGYYIFYEKNLAMQSYMIYKREEEMRLAELKYSESAEDDKEETRFAEETIREDDVDEETEGVSADREAGIAKDKARIARDEQVRESAIHTQEWQDAKPMPKEPKTQAEEALESYRRMLLERQGRREERQNRRFLYTASSFFLVVLCVIGITTINNYRKMQEVESVLNVMRHGGEQPASGEKADLAEKDAASAESSLVVESVESKIEPLQEETSSNEADTGNASDGAQKANAGAADGMEKEDDAKAAEGGNQQGTGENAEGAKQQGAGENAEGAKQQGTENAEGASQQGIGENAEGAKQGDAGKDAGATDKSSGTEDAQAATQETFSVEQEGDKRYYTVKAGDTLNTICLNIYHSKDMVQKLKEINGIEDGDKILVGQKLLLP